MPTNKQRPHILLLDTPKPEKYKYPGSGGSPRPLPPRDRVSHAEYLLGNLDRARSEARTAKEQIKAWAVPAKKGIHLEFESEPGFDLELKSLDSRSPKGTQLVTVRESPEHQTTLATVFVPEGQLKRLETKIRKYETEDTTKGRPRNQQLIEKISQIRRSADVLLERRARGLSRCRRGDLVGSLAPDSGRRHAAGLSKNRCSSRDPRR